MPCGLQAVLKARLALKQHLPQPFAQHVCILYGFKQYFAGQGKKVGQFVIHGLARHAEVANGFAGAAHKAQQRVSPKATCFGGHERAQLGKVAPGSARFGEGTGKDRQQGHKPVWHVGERQQQGCVGNALGGQLVGEVGFWQFCLGTRDRGIFTRQVFQP